MRRDHAIAFVAIGLSLTGRLIAQKPADTALALHTLSTRPEFVTGGDVLVEVAGTSVTASGVRVELNGHDVSASFKPATERGALVGLVSGLQPGPNIVRATQRKTRAVTQLTVVNHPAIGPVLYSPHQTPFVCETEASGLGPPLDADCSVTTRVDYFYRTTSTPPAAGRNADDPAAADNANGFAGGGTSPFKPLDVNRPRPADIAMTTTLEGKTVPYIVRREIGTINRAIYSIAFLHDPATPLPSPWTTSTAWNGRLVYSFGGGVAAGYHQGRTIGGLSAGRANIEDGQLGDYPVAKGYAVAGSSQNVTGTYDNDVVSAESMMMVKEHFIESFGVPRYTIGSGRSGGAMQQHLLANNYPGLLDGIVPTASFPDTVTYQMSLTDCELLDHAMAVSKLPWTIDQKTAVSGYSHFDYCTSNKLRYAGVSADINCDGATIPASMRFDAVSNPKGVRCTYQDSLVNVFGRDPATGFARRPFDNVGVQYGLAAFNAGKISFALFLDLNRLVGGHDINGGMVAARTVADPEALRLAHDTGRINDAAHGLSMVPIIDMRPYAEGPGGNVHDTFDGAITRARLIAANGNADNQIFRVYAPGASIVKAQDDNLDILDRWLAAIRADAAPGNVRDKVLRNKPQGLTDSCFTAKLEEIKEPSKCAAMFPVFSNARVAAGAPPTDDLLKCELKPVDKSDYKRPLSDVQLTALRAVFPDGVCDYSRKGVSQLPARTWLSFPGGLATGTR